MRDNLRMIVFVVVLGIVLSAVIFAVNSFTAPRIAKNDELTTKRTILDAHAISYQESDLETVFSQDITVVKTADKTYYALKNGDIAFEFNGSGLWGPIRGVISLKSDLQSIKRIVVIHQEETAGLGGRLAERKYLSSFDGKKFAPTILILNRRRAAGDTEVDGISGATLTSKAFEKLLNEQVAEYLRGYGG